MATCRILRNPHTNEIQTVLAPNGSESALYRDILDLPELLGNKEEALRLWAQVYTPSFKSWFGDWENDESDASKVVDENGEPLLVYHGSPVKGLTSFEKNFQGTSNYLEGNRGFFFTSYKHTARMYSMKSGEFDPNASASDIYGEIYPVFLNVRDLEAHDLGPLGITSLYEGKIDKVNAALDRGAGVVFIMEGADEFIVDDPSQIKSVFNNGQFANENNNIFYYGNSINKINEKLKTGFFHDFNITIQEYEDIKTTLGYNSSQMVDVVSKVINFNKGESLDKAAAYLAYKMLGKANNKITSELNYHITAWNRYNELFNKYAAEFKDQNIYLSDKRTWRSLIREKIIVDYLADTIVRYNDSPLEFEKLEKRKWTPADFTFFQKLLREFKNLLRKFKFDDRNVNVVENISRNIAYEILNRDYDIYNYRLGSEQILKFYDSTISSDPKAAGIVSTIRNTGAILSGSLALRKAGTIYRADNESLHDLDFIVPNSMVADQKNISKIINSQTDNKEVAHKVAIEEIQNFDWYKDIQAAYPDIKVIRGFYGAISSNRNIFTLTSVINGAFYESNGSHEITKPDGSTQRIKHVKGDYVEGTGYILDFFVNLKYDDNRGFSDIWKEVMSAKLMIGRRKDLTDYKFFVPYNYGNMGSFDNLSLSYRVIQAVPKGTAFNEEDQILYYGTTQSIGTVESGINESNEIFLSQLQKIKSATHGTLVEGRKVNRQVVKEIIADIISKGPRQDYDHIGFDHTTGTLKFYNRVSFEANERAKKAVKLLEDLTTRTGLPYKIDYYLEVPGEFVDGVAVINPYHPKFGSDIVWHEALGHPIVEAIFQQAENSTLYSNLKAQVDENIGGIKDYLRDEYSELTENSDDYYKEAITTLLGRYLDFHNKTIDTFQINQEISLGSAIVKFLERFLNRVKNVLNDIIENYNSSTRRIKVEDLKNNNFTVQELATILGSTQSFFDLSDVKFKGKMFAKATTISPLEQAIYRAQTQGVTKSLEEQLESARQQANKQFRLLTSKVTPEQRKTLQRLLNYLEDPETYGKIRTFAAYMSETDVILKYYFEKGIELSKATTSNADKISELRFILQVAESYEPIIRSLEDEYIYVDQENDIKKLIEHSKSLINQIKVLYRREIETPLVAELSTGIGGATTEITKQLEGEITYLQGRLATATPGTGRYASLKAQIAKLEEQKERLIPNQDNLLATLRGQRGDSNILSMWLEAPVAGGDMIISSFAKKIKDMFNTVRSKLLPLKNEAQSQLDTYSQATGRSTTNSKTFYEGLYETVKRGRINNETGELEIEEYYALVGQFNQDYVLDHQKWINELNQLKKAGDMPAYRAKQREFEEWKNKFMEREYTEAYYTAEKLLTDEAKEAQKELLDQIGIVKDLIRSNQGSIEDSEALNDLWAQYTDLGRLYDRRGLKKTGKDLAIAESIRAFRAARREMESFELTEDGRATFESEKKKQEDKLANGYITNEEFDKWLRKNTTRRISPEFYLERGKIIKRISDILGKIPPEIIGKESQDELWEQVFAIAGNHRDEDRVVDGSDISSEELSHVKSSEEKLEAIREKAISLSGLTPLESQELNALFNLEYDERTERDQDRINTLLALKKERKATILQYVTPADLRLLDLSFEELKQIQQWDTTTYYDRAYKENFEAWWSTQPESISSPGLKDSDITQMKFQATKWFKDNHIWKQKAVIKNGEFQGYEDVPQPLYIWRDVLPTNLDWVDYGYPSFKYLERIVKPEFVNSNYRDSVDGYNIPKLEVEEGGKIVSSKYVNQKYEDLKNATDSTSRAKFEMLQFLTTTYMEGQSKIPKDKRMGLLIPAIEKDTYDRILDSKGLGSAARQQWNNVKRDWTLTEQDSDVALGDVAGIEFNYIPVKYSGRISTDDVSLNLMQSILKYRYMAEEYEVLEQTQALSYALQTSIDDDSNRISTGKVDAFLKKLGFDVKVLGRGQSNRSKQLQEFIKTIWYGELQKDEHIFNLSINKVTNNVMGIAALQMLALKIPAHVTNLISGEVQQFIEANANKYFTLSDYQAAKRRYAQNIVNFWQDYRKEGKKSLMSQIVDLYDVMQGETEDEFGTKTNYSELREGRNWLFFTKNAGEHEIQVSTFIAMATNKKVKKGDSTISLIDAYELDDKGNIKLKDGVEFTTQEFNDFVGKVHSLLKDLNGNYNKFDRPLVEKHSIGRLFTFLRKYLVPMFVRRYQGSRADLEMGEVQEGYYIAFARTMMLDIMKYRFNLIQRWGDLTDREKDAVRRTCAELGTILLFTAIIALLGGYDDDRKLSEADLASWEFWKNHILYQAMKVKSETENFLPLPGLGFDEAIRTGTTTTIAWRPLANVASLFSEIGNTMIGSDKAYFNRDYGIWDQGDMKLTARLGKLIGFTGNEVHPELMIKNFELSQRVK